MVTLSDIKTFFKEQGYKMVIVADAEPYVSTVQKDGSVSSKTPAGGVGVALDPLARATNAVYIARAKNKEERIPLDKDDKMLVGDSAGNFMLKRLFFTPQQINDYYFGFSNQTLWPLCHVAFEEPRFNNSWYKGYKKVNETFAKAVNQEMKGKTFVWLHDYQLALIPSLLRKPKDTIVALFWHIPWPTWEVFRILPYKKEILESLLLCDFLAFHRGYQAQNFLETVERELEARIDREKQQVHYKDHITTVKSLPLGIDTDLARSQVRQEDEIGPLGVVIRELLGLSEEKEHPLDWYFEKYKVIFGVDRLDYTKGISHRLQAIDRFFEKNPKAVGKVIYLGITAPSREQIDAYKQVKKQSNDLTTAINAKYETKDWKPIHNIHALFSREDVLNFYKKAHLCIVTPLDDGMNLVSKEFVIAASLSSDPGMLVLSQFAGSAIDLTSALIVNPYDIDQVADAIKEGLEMSREDRITRIKQMSEMLDEKNIYDWAYTFLREAIAAGR